MRCLIRSDVAEANQVEVRWNISKVVDDDLEKNLEEIEKVED